MDGCHHDKPLLEAEAICSDAGARLCTAAELRADCTRGTGCGHDVDLIWSSDACDPDDDRRQLSSSSQRRLSSFAPLAADGGSAHSSAQRESAAVPSPLLAAGAVLALAAIAWTVARPERSRYSITVTAEPTAPGSGDSAMAV